MLKQAIREILAAEYRYGLQNRPAGYATVPKGYVTVEPHPKFRHGVVVYDHPLTPDEIKSFELVPILSPKEIEERIAKVVDDLTEPDYLEGMRELFEDDSIREIELMIRTAWTNTGLGWESADIDAVTEKVLEKIREITITV